METKKINPAPLGLLGFGMTTILLNLHNAGFIELSVVIMAMGIAMGGLAQLIAGILEFKNGNTFGGVAFTAYGCFWWSLVYIWTNPNKVLAADSTSVGMYLLLWGIFTAFMFIGTLKHDRATQVVFGTLALLFIFLAIGDLSETKIITTIGGYIGILCGASAMYTSAAKILNAEYEKVILPIGNKH